MSGAGEHTARHIQNHAMRAVPQSLSFPNTQPLNIMGSYNLVAL